MTLQGFRRRDVCCFGKQNVGGTDFCPARRRPAATVANALKFERPVVEIWKSLRMIERWIVRTLDNKEEMILERGL